MPGIDSDVTLVYDADDRASKKISASDKVLEHFGKSVGRTALQFASLTGIMGLFGVSIYTLGDRLRGMVARAKEAREAAADLQLRFRVMGFSSDAAASAVADLRENLDRATLISIPSMEQALLQFISTLDMDTVNSLEIAGKKLNDLSSKVDSNAEGFKIMAEAAAGNLKPLQDIIGPVNSFEEGLSLINEEHQKFLQNRPEVLKFWDELKEKASPLGDALKSVGGALSGVMDQFFRNSRDALREFDLTPDISKSFDENVVKPLTETLPAVVTRLFEMGQSLGGGLISGVAAGIGLLSEFFTGAFIRFFTEKLPSWATDLFNMFKGAGANVVAGLWDGIQSLGPWLYGQVKSFAEGIYNSVKAGLGKLWPGSPSEAGVDLGEGLLLGIGKGIDENIGLLQHSLDRVSAPVTEFGGGLRQGQAGAGASGFRQPLVIQVGDRELVRLVLEVLDGELRAVEPSLGLT